MNPHERRARDALEGAELLLRAGHAAGAANRAYYAVFHAARGVVALLAAIDPLDVKTHQGLRRLFELHAVKTNLIPIEIAQHMNDVESTRLVADYGPEMVQIAEAEAAVRDARSFVETCSRLLREHQP